MGYRYTESLFASEIENLAVLIYLLGKNFILQTDYNPLKWLGKLRNQNLRMTRWGPSFQPYEFDIEYRPARLILMPMDYPVVEVDDNIEDVI